MQVRPEFLIEAGGKDALGRAVGAQHTAADAGEDAHGGDAKTYLPWSVYRKEQVQHAKCNTVYIFNNCKCHTPVLLQHTAIHYTIPANATPACDVDSSLLWSAYREKQVQHTFCNTYNARHCNSLQPTTTHCKTRILQHTYTAIDCNKSVSLWRLYRKEQV